MRLSKLRRRRVRPRGRRLSVTEGSRSSEAILFHAAIERAATEAEGLGGLADVAVGAGEGFADEDGFDGFEAHVVEALAGGAGGVEAEVADLYARVAGHEDGALDGVVELADVTGPGVLQH